MFYTKKVLERKRTKIQTNIELKMVNNWPANRSPKPKKPDALED